MQRQNYMITAEEVAESMGISLGYAYKLLRKLNKELADQGYVTVAGKIPRAFCISLLVALALFSN